MIVLKNYKELRKCFGFFYYSFLFRFIVLFLLLFFVFVSFFFLGGGGGGVPKQPCFFYKDLQVVALGYLK